MKFFEKLFGKKKPPEPPAKPIPGYDYWQYREDIFNPMLSFDQIMIRCDGKIPRPPRRPKLNEMWEYRGCRKHGTPTYSYPLRIMVLTDSVPEIMMPFVVCGCLVPVEGQEKKLEGA
jgi:hypothetical protein